LHFIASVLTVSGILVLADAAATLLWQEPVSWFISGREQAQLEEAVANPPRRVALKKPREGDGIGRISLPTLDRDYYLRVNAATVGIAGHRTTYGAPFRTIDKLQKGNPVVLDIPYGRFTYRVEKTRIVPPTQVEVKRKVSYDRLILSACHPLYSAAQRIVVFARLVKPAPWR
jgi:sortase A